MTPSFAENADCKQERLLTLADEAALVARLNRGEIDAAAEAFSLFAPDLRRTLRLRIGGGLRAKLDPSDVVQSVWIDMARGLRQRRWQLRDITQLRALLLTMTRNRLIDRWREHRLALRREASGPLSNVAELVHDRSPRPSQNAHADDLWRQMLALCPCEHHELLALKHQGASLAEIAARTGLHPSSVRRVLYQLARSLARKRLCAVRP